MLDETTADGAAVKRAVSFRAWEVNGCPHLCASPHLYAPLRTSPHPSAPLRTPLHPSAPLCTPPHPSAPLRTPLHPSAPLRTPLHPSAPLCTPLHPSAPLHQGPLLWDARHKEPEKLWLGSRPDDMRSIAATIVTFHPHDASSWKAAQRCARPSPNLKPSPNA